MTVEIKIYQNSCPPSCWNTCMILCTESQTAETQLQQQRDGAIILVFQVLEAQSRTLPMELFFTNNTLKEKDCQDQIVRCIERLFRVVRSAFCVIFRVSPKKSAIFQKCCPKQWKQRFAIPPNFFRFFALLTYVECAAFKNVK